MSQIQTPTKIPSKYANVSYLIDTKNVSDKGTLSHLLLNHSVKISCVINVPSKLLEDIEHAIISVVYNQVFSKACRYKARMSNRADSPVFYRDDLETSIGLYALNNALNKDFVSIKPLLLNYPSATIFEGFVRDFLIR
jgi:hypothetical protein